VKTDRRDATKLARLLRSRELTPVWVPDEPHEAFRDLTRAREDVRHDQLRARHRLTKLLLRQGIQPPRGMTAWTQRHRAWLQTVQLPYPAQQVVFAEYLLAIDQLTDRLRCLETAIADTVATSSHAPLIAALQALRGIGLVSAATLVAECGDLTRFRTSRELMAYAGLVPAEYSTGRRQYRGAITKTGNAHVRHILVEAAWHYRHRPAVWGGLRRRQTGQAEAVKAIAWDAQVRLHRRFQRLTARGKPAHKAVVAIARELLGFILAIGQAVGRPGTVAA
jgi:transposase